MNMKQIAVVGIFTLVGSSVMAAPDTTTNTSKEEGRGALTGAVIGASVGGPLGAGLGAIIGGGIIGKLIGVSRVNGELMVANEELEIVIQSRQKEKRGHDQKMKVQIANLSQELNAMLRSQTQSWNSRQLPIQFRTGSSEIESQYVEQLNQIAHILSRNLDTKVSLSGFADRRGDLKYNQSLSENRVIQIQQYLASRGVKNSQILTNAYGETKPISHEDSYENDFFDRRVVMKFSFDVKSYLAAR